MNKKSIIICTLTALLLLGGVVYLFYSLFFDSGRQSSTVEVSVSDGAAAVPSDAVFLVQTDKLSNLLELSDDGSSLGAFYKALPHDSGEWQTVWSVHYASKNKVAPLVIIEVPEKVGSSSLASRLSNDFKGVIEKRFNSHTIYKSAVPNISFAAYGKYLIASPSLIILESSLRHLDNEASILDEPWLDKINGVEEKNGMAHIAFDNLGKIFSGVASSDRIKHASFVQKIASWGVFGISHDNGRKTFNGKLYNPSTGESFSEVLLTQRGRKSDVFSVAPYNTGYLLSVPITSYSSYISAYKSYLTANGKKGDYDYFNAILPKIHKDSLSSSKFMDALQPEEVAVWSHGTAGESPVVLAVKTSHPEAMKNYTDTICKNLFPGYIPTVMGGIFKPSSDTHYMVCDSWILFCDEATLTQIKEQRRDHRYFTLESYLEQTPASEELRKLSNVTLLLNLNRSGKFLTSCLKEAYASRLTKSIGPENFQFAILHGFKLNSEIGTELSLYSEDLAQQPVMPVSKKAAAAQPIVEDIEITIPKGPFPIKNFKDGSTNYIEQLDNYDIRLLNSSKKAVWTIKFKTPICGTVQQIDYLRNNKLQILFGSEDKIYLFDRLGRPVGKYPHSLGKKILLGPKVYDFRGDKNYTLLVLHEDNSICQYSTTGEKSATWQDIILSEKVIELPELMKVGSNYFWVIRTLYQTLVYNSQGLPVADFSDKKNKLRRDTEIEVMSSHEVAVTSTEGRKLVLDLNNGKFRRK